VASAGEQLAAIKQEIERRSNTPVTADTIALMCGGVLQGMALLESAPQIAPSMGEIAKALNAVQGQNAELGRCQARIDIAEMRYADAAARLSQASLNDGDELTLLLAWAQLSAGDTAAAVQSAKRYAAARLQDNTLLPADAALVMLIVRHQPQPLTDALQTYLAQTRNAGWPRPVLSYLADTMSQQELLQIASGLDGRQRDLAMNDAWFAIGARLLADGQTEEAIAALQWSTIHGVPGSRTAMLAQGTLALLSPPDNDVRQSLAAATATPPDYAAARTAYLKAAARGVGSAEAALGFLALHGRGETADPAAAVAWYRKAADHGDADGKNYLGQAYEKGIGVAADQDLAARWYARAAEFGHYDASFNLGRFYLGGKGGLPVDRPAAFQHVHAAAQLGNASAQAWLTAMYGYGIGTSRDADLAYYWASRAAQHDNLDGIVSLGQALYHSMGVAPDAERAVELWSRAASNDSARAMYYLSTAYETGTGVPKRWETGFGLYMKGLKIGNPDQMLDLASLGEPDYAYRLMSMLREGGRSEQADGVLRACAQREVARCQNSMGVNFQHTDNPNLVEAAQWYRKAADQGHPQSLNNLADMYEKGLGVEVDLPRAIRMYRQGARQGNATSLFSLGELYETGKGMAADPYLAYVYYELGARRGWKDADAARNRIAKRLSSAQIKQARATIDALKAYQPLPDGLNEDGTGAR